MQRRLRAIRTIPHSGLGTTQVPHIVDVTHAGLTPLERFILNPPTTSPGFPQNPPRAVARLPLRPADVHEPLTMTRPPGVGLSALPAGAYAGSVGRLVLMHGLARYDDTRQAYAPELSYVALGSTGGSAETITIKAGQSHKISNVERFRITDSRVMVGQQVGRDLHLIARTVGMTTVKYTPIGRTEEISVKFKVERITKEDAVKASVAIFQRIKNIIKRPALQLDWNDAEVLRNYRQTIRDVLRPISNAARDLGYTKAMNRLNFLLMVLDVAHANPHLVTLHQVLQEVKKQPWGDAASFHNVCVVDFKDDIPFRWGYDFAATWTTFIDIASVVAMVVAFAASVAASFFTAGSTAAVTLAVIAGALSAAAAEMTEFSHSPKRLVAHFGRAICAARDREVLPARVEAAAKLRATVLSAYDEFQAAMASIARRRGRASEEELEVDRNTAYMAAVRGQEALLELLTIDDPGFFATYRPEEDRRFQAAREELNRVANDGVPVDAPTDTRIVSLDTVPAAHRALLQHMLARGNTHLHTAAVERLRTVTTSPGGRAQKKEGLNTAIVIGASVLITLGISYAVMRKN